MPNMSFEITGVTPTPSMTLARTLPQTADEIPNLSPLALFQSQMSSGSTESKVDAMKRLQVVARAMCDENGNNEAVMTQLVPYLQSLVLQQGAEGSVMPPAAGSNPPSNTTNANNNSPIVLEDEILLMLAKQLKFMVPSLLSTPQQILTLLPILERLAAVEETVVRDQAVDTVQHVALQLQLSSAPAAGASSSSSAATPTTAPPPLVEPSVSQILVGMARRCTTADWFTPKVSVAGMIPTLYQVTHHAELPYLYRELCQDETPMVRRAASKSLGKLLEKLGKHASQQSRASANELATVCLRNLCQDEQDSVRMLAVAALADVGPTYGNNTPDWTKEHFAPFVRLGSTDMSWRVRHNLSKHFSAVAQNLGFAGNPKYAADQSMIMSCFVSLLTDVEPEVRAAAVGHFAPMVHWGGSDLFQSHLQPHLPGLADDLVMEVRSKCALAIMDSSQGGTLEDALILQCFGPLLESFLQDEFQEVQLQVLHNLSKMSHLLHDMNGVVGAVLNMARATNWRVREGVGRLLPHLGQARGAEFFVTVLLEPCWLGLLLDPVASVRAACVSGMETLVRTAGQEWMVQHILPQHIRIYNHAASSSYLIRITILQAHAATAIACTSSNTSAGANSTATPSPTESSLWNDVVLQLLRGITDNVANVRMVAAKGLHQVIVSASKNHAESNAFIQTQVLSALQQQLSQEQDMDCRDTCQMALDAISK